MTDTKRKNILIVTTTRADWGILSAPARLLATRKDVNLKILAANMHVDPRYGATVGEIIDEGIFDVETAELPRCRDVKTWRTEIMSALANSTAEVIERFRPDAMIVLGDRFEILGAVSAALIASVPVVHLHGGEISEGAIDDSVRNAVSQMASLHLVSTEGARRRLTNMGIAPDTIVRTGSIGLENTLEIKPLTRQQLIDSIDSFNITSSHTLLVTYHPVTRHPDRIPAAVQLDNLLGALDDAAAEGFNCIITAPNNDPGSEEIYRRFEEYAALHPERVKLVKSLGRLRYLSALHHVRAVVGNTSSGLLEAPATSAATINIGPRQKGRECPPSVIQVSDNRDDISRAIIRLKDTVAAAPDLSCNPYYAPRAAETAVKAIMNFVL